MDPIKNTQANLLASLKNLVPLIPGTIRTVHLCCGKALCPCMSDHSKKHGPYFFWDRKIAGKLSSKSINKSQVKIIQLGINNRRKLENVAKQLLLLGDKFATSLQK